MIDPALMKRRKPIPRKRAKPRRGQPTKAEKKALRWAVYERARGICELRLMPGCLGPVPFNGSLRVRGHLVHLKSRGAGGKWDMENCRWGCAVCHLDGMHTKGVKYGPDSTL